MEHFTLKSFPVMNRAKRSPDATAVTVEPGLIAGFPLTESACHGGDTENFAFDAAVRSESTGDFAMPRTSHCLQCGLFTPVNADPL
jgi:hypothetical protein